MNILKTKVISQVKLINIAFISFVIKTKAMRNEMIWTNLGVDSLKRMQKFY